MVCAAAMVPLGMPFFARTKPRALYAGAKFGSSSIARSYTASAWSRIGCPEIAVSEIEKGASVERVDFDRPAELGE